MTPSENAARPWRKASACLDSEACVEVADAADGGAAVRRSGDPAGAVLEFSALEWSAFVAGVLAGEFGGVR